MTDDSNDYKEAVLYKKYSLFITIVSLPFLVMGHILQDSSTFATDIMSWGVVGLMVGIPCLVFWDNKSKKLKNSRD